MYEILFIVVIILLLILILLYNTTNESNKNIVNKGCSGCMLSGGKDKYNYCINKNKVFYESCPINNSADTTYINVVSTNCKFNNLKIFGCQFRDCELLNITNGYFGYTTYNKTMFFRCIFNSISDTVFDRVIFYRYNSFNNVSLNNVTFDNVEFLDAYYLFNFSNNILMFYNLAIGNNTIIQFTGDLPIYVNLSGNINNKMIVNNVYEFSGYKYKLILNGMNNVYTFVKIL